MKHTRALVAALVFGIALLMVPHVASAEELLEPGALSQQPIEVVDAGAPIQSPMDSNSSDVDLLGGLGIEEPLEDDTWGVEVQQTSSNAMTPQEYFARSDAFVADSRWCNATTWGWQTPKIAEWTSWQCFAYACDYAKYMYDIDNYEWGTYYGSLSQIRTGDVVRAGGHSFVVLERNGDYLRTAEGNYGGRVRVADPGFQITSDGIIQLGGNRYLAFEKGYHFDTGGATTREAAEPISLKGASVKLSGYSYAYTGKARKPKVVKVILNGQELAAGTDYKVTYKNNVNAGTARVIIRGKGAYTGKVQKRFTIRRKSVKKLLVGSVRDRAYTGKVIRPRPVLRDGSQRLVRNVDYTLTYKNCKKLGTGTIVITGKGNYTGSRSVTFSIYRL